MAVDTKHPEYVLRYEDWVLLSDCFEGEGTVKSKGSLYMPATEGMVQDGFPVANTAGYRSYVAYRLRAKFPDFVKTTVETMLGLMHQEPPRIVVPKKLEPVLVSMSSTGEPANALLRRINRDQLLYGRLGLLIDTPNGTDGLPYVSCYTAMSLINWNDGMVEAGRQKLQLVVLEESEQEMQPTYEWEYVDKYRVLRLGSGSTYEFGTSRERSEEPTNFSSVTYRGRTLDRIPFVFVNANDLVPSVAGPPLLGLADLCMSIYRTEADYRQNLHMQGQDTLVITGSDEAPEKKLRVGAGARIDISNDKARAEYIGVGSAGLSEQRYALEGDRSEAAEIGGKLLDFSNTSRQSGQALSIRVATKTATLRSIAFTGGEALRQTLVLIGEFMGLSEEELNGIVVEPNTDFTDDAITGQDMLQMMSAKSEGLPLSYESIHRYLRKKDITEFTFEEENELLDSETDRNLNRLPTNGDQSTKP